MNALPEPLKAVLGFVRKFGKLLLIVQIPGLIIGLGVVFFADHRDFRARQEERLADRWAVIERKRGRFESHIGKIDGIFHGGPSPSAGSEYGSDAFSYIQSMEAIGYFLPDTVDELHDYIGAIRGLRRYYDVVDLPEPETDEWMVLYGKFRRDYDRYAGARERYFGALSDELGDYARHAANS